MDIIIENSIWMTLNVLLALVALFFAMVMLRSKQWYYRCVFGGISILFLPNTIYLFTDIFHIFSQWTQVTGVLQVLLALQYVLLVVIGAITFVLGLYPLEVLLRERVKSDRNVMVILIVLNFVIGFGMMMGRVARTHSFYVFTDLQRVITDMVFIATTVELMLLVVVCGLICNLVYFYTKAPVLSVSRALYTYGKAVLDSNKFV